MSSSYLSVSIGQEFGSGLAVCFWVRVSWCCSQHVSRGDMLEGAVGSNSKMSHLPDDWQVGAGCFSLCGSLHKTPWVSLGHDIRLGQEQVIWESQDSLWLHLRIHTLWCSQYRIGYTVQPCPVREGTIQRCECHEARITVGHLVGSLPQPEILKKKKKDEIWIGNL